MVKMINFNKSFQLIAYKLLHDALFLSVISFAGMIVVEGVLPGLISSHIGLAKMAIIILILLTIIIWLGGKLQIAYHSEESCYRKLLPFITVFAFLLVGNSLLKFAFWENIIITTATLAIFFLMYIILFSGKK